MMPANHIPGFQPFRARHEWRDDPPAFPELAAPRVSQSPLADAETRQQALAAAQQAQKARTGSQARYADEYLPSQAEQRREARASARGLALSVFWGAIIVVGLVGVAAGFAIGAGW